MRVDILTQIKLWFFSRLYTAFPNLLLKYHERARYVRRIRALEDQVIEEQGRSAGKNEAMMAMIEHHARHIKLLQGQHAAEVHRLMAMAQRDALTGLLNLHGAQLELGPLVARELRLRHELDPKVPPTVPMTAIFIDLDKFKLVNDTFGHAAGDKLLIAFAHILREVFRRPDDILVRKGGDEFVIYLLDASPEGVQSRIGEFLSVFTPHPEMEQGNIRVLASIGIAHALVQSHQRVEEATRSVTAAADQMMYQAKRSSSLQPVCTAEDIPIFG